MNHVTRGRPGCFLQSARGEANRIFLPSALSSMHRMCPNRVSHDVTQFEPIGLIVSFCV